MSTSELARLAAMERLAARDLTQRQVALQLGISVRQVKRLLRRFRSLGPAGLQSQRRGRPSNRRVDPALLVHALSLVRKHYADCGPTFAAEKLLERHQLRFDHETLRRAMIDAGLWQVKMRRIRTVHQPRLRRPCFGELVQIDASHHAWFEDRAPRCALYVAIDDATSSLLALHFAETETTEGYFELMRSLILEHGVPQAVYSDRHSIFRINGECEKEEQLTQFGRAMARLNVQSICANSPQAKGRVERANGTLQRRLVKELRYHNISTIDSANEFLIDFISKFNARFAKLPPSDTDLHQPPPPLSILDRILANVHERTVSKNLTVHFENELLLIQRRDLQRRLAHAKVIVGRDRLGQLFVERNGEALSFECIEKLAPAIADSKTIDATLRSRRIPNPKKAHIPPMSHPWKGGNYRAVSSRGHL